MIIDFHTHIFPPSVREERAEYVRRDGTFAEMYGDPRAEIATAEDLLASMDAAGVDFSVVTGFAWSGHDDIVGSNDYVLKAGAESGGRLIPFVTVNMAEEGAEAEVERCVSAGARGIGELRPGNQGWELNGSGGARLAAMADEFDLPLLFHVTEEGAHEYPGKRGCSLASFVEYSLAHPGLVIIGAHLGGGIYGMPDPPNVFVDTAAVPFLHKPSEQPRELEMVPPDRLLFASDYPLISQERALREFREAVSGASVDAGLGENGASLLGISIKVGK